VAFFAPILSGKEDCEMLKNANLDYFYPTEAEQFTFYRIPKILFTDKR